MENRFHPEFRPPRLLPSQGRGASAGKQSGVALLEALLAILVFSLGILTVIAIQGASVKMTADTQLRTRAVLLANQLIGQMWASGYEADKLADNFGTGKAEYQNWLDNNVKADGGLPGVDGGKCDDITKPANTLPKVEVTSEDDKTDPTNGTVTITLCWRTPNMKPDEDSRRHIVTTQISRNL